jgi:Flp pilus assembly protein TadG
MRNERRAQRGAAAVEFALVLPLLMILIVGTMEWGRYFVVRESVVHAAREGARGGTLLDATQEDACAAVTAFLATIHLAPSCPGDVEVEMNASVNGGSAPIPAVAVRVNVPFAPVTQLPLFVPTNIRVEAVMPTWRPAAGGGT